MTDETLLFKHNKAIRGYIMRSLAKGHNNTLLCRQLVNVMINDAVIVSPDVSKHLSYLHDRGYIKYIDKKINSYNVYANDSVLQLTAKGVDLIEGTIDDPGVDI